MKNIQKKNSFSSLAITVATLSTVIGQTRGQTPVEKQRLDELINSTPNYIPVEIIPDGTISTGANDQSTSIQTMDEQEISRRMNEFKSLLGQEEGNQFDKIQSGLQQKKLSDNLNRLALTNAALSFGIAIPDNYQDLRKKIQDSLREIGENPQNDTAALEKILSFSADLTAELKDLYLKDQNLESTVLAGARFITRLQLTALDYLVSGFKDFIHSALSSEVGTLMAIFQTLFALYEIIKNAKTKQPAQPPAKTPSRMSLKQQTLGNTYKIHPRAAEAVKSRLRVLIIEFSTMVENCTNPEDDYKAIYDSYHKKICGFINDVKVSNFGRLPDVREIQNAWLEFNCEAGQIKKKKKH